MSKDFIQLLLNLYKRFNFRPLLTILLILGFIKISEKWRLPYFDISEGDKNIVGSVLGALLGTLGAFILAQYAATKQRQLRDDEDERDRLRSYSRKILDFEIELNLSIPITVKNIRMFRKCSTPEKYGNFMGTLPRAFVLNAQDVRDLRNPQLINEWTTLSARSIFISQLIEDFNEEYKRLRDVTYSHLVAGDTVNNQYIIQTHQILIDFARDAMEAVQDYKKASLRVLALIQLHGDKSSVQLFKNIEELHAQFFEEHLIDLKVEEISPSFTEDKIAKPESD